MDLAYATWASSPSLRRHDPDQVRTVGGRQPPSQPGASGLPRVLYVGHPSPTPSLSVREPPPVPRPPAPPSRSLDGLVMAPVADQAPGQVGTRTRFTYHEKDGEIWAEYAGGDVVRGHLVGTRA